MEAMFSSLDLQNDSLQNKNEKTLLQIPMEQAVCNHYMIVRLISLVTFRH